MLNTPKMTLKIWNLLSDLFDHNQLADNWATIDGHDHTFGKGVQIPTGGIADGAISTSKIALGAVTIADLAPVARPLQMVEATAPVAAVGGNLIVVTVGNGMVTLPAPLAGTTVGVVAPFATSNGTVTVRTPSGLIFGAGLGATSCQVGAAGVILASDDANWVMVQGVQGQAYGGQAPVGTSVVAGPNQVMQALSGTIITLPPVQKDIWVTVRNADLTGVVAVAAIGTTMNGPGCIGAATIFLGTPGSFVTLLCNGIVWSVVGGAQDTGWVTISSLGTNISSPFGSSYPAAVRLVADVVRLRGALSAGGTITSGSVVATVGPGFIPSHSVQLAESRGSGNAASISVNATSGAMQFFSNVSLGAGDGIGLDGLTYSLS